MTLQNKLWIVAGGGVILLLLLAVVAYPLFRQDPENENTLPSTIVSSPSELEPLPADNSIVADPTIEPVPTTSETFTEDDRAENAQKAEVERTTRLVLERIGSYSNYSNYENVTSIETFLTPSMQSYVNSTLKAQQSNQGTSSYYGVTTRATRLNLTQFTSSTSATIAFSVYQQVQDGLQADIVQTIKEGTVQLLFQDGIWKVNGIFYEN